MKDYSLILEATNNAKALLNDYIPLANQELRQKGADVLHQIAEYLQTQLKNAGFPDINVFEKHMNDYGDEVTNGDIILECRKKPNWRHERESFNIHLYVYTYAGALNIYINESNFVIEGTEKDYAVLCLCEYWKKLKSSIEPAIDRYFRCKNQEIEDRIRKIERDRTILDNFEL